jgi:hypothetical protein
VKWKTVLAVALVVAGVSWQTPAVAAGSPEPAAIFAPGTISTAIEEYRIVFDLDGGTAYFGRSQEFFPAARQSTIMVSRRANGVWTAATPVSFSGTHSDLDPFITPDGRQLFFSSIRPVDGVARTDVDLWAVRRGPGGGWGEPRHLGAVNSGYDELYPSVATDGSLYFASDRPGGLGGFDMYRARPRPDGTYGPAENLGAPINTAGWEFNPVILPAGNLLLFTGLDRAGGYGLGDQWQAVRHGQEWSTPRNLGPAVNTAADEYHLSFSPRYDRAYFVRHTYEPWVPGDIYTLPVWRLLLP